ncbi:MAG: DUF6428 family protein [Balneolales bacterium]
MKTSEFIELLETHKGLDLHFEYKPGRYIRPDYHITEIKNVNFDTVDCGGHQNQWQETHVQLWESEIHDSPNKVDTTKALKIFEVVNKVRPTYQDTEVMFEYGNSSFTTAILPVANVMVDDSKMTVQLVTNQTTCKAKDRAGSPEEANAACCGTPSPVELQILEDSSTHCTPGGGCC